MNSIIQIVDKDYYLNCFLYRYYEEIHFFSQQVGLIKNSIYGNYKNVMRREKVIIDQNDACLHSSKLFEMKIDYMKTIWTQW